MSDEVSLIVNGNRKTLIKHSGKTTSKIVVVDAKGDGLTRDDDVTIIGDTSKFTKEEIEQNLFANYQNKNTANAKETATAYRKTGDAFKFTTSHKFSLGSMYDAVEQKSAPSVSSSSVGNTGNSGQNDADMISAVKKFDPAELNKASMDIMGGMFPMGFGGMGGSYSGFCDFGSIVGAYQNLLKYCQGLFGAPTSSNPSVSNPDGSTPTTADKQPASVSAPDAAGAKSAAGTDDTEDPSLKDDSEVKTRKHHKKHAGKASGKKAEENKAGTYKPTHFFTFEEFKKANPNCEITPYGNGSHRVTTKSGSKYEFDAKGHMTKKVNDGATTTFSYENDGTLKSKKVVKNGLTVTTSYKKTAEGSQLTYNSLTKYLEKKGQTYTSTKNTIKYKYGNTTKTYTFDNAGKLLSAKCTSGSIQVNIGSNVCTDDSTITEYKKGYQITTNVKKTDVSANYSPLR